MSTLLSLHDNHLIPGLEGNRENEFKPIPMDVALQKARDDSELRRDEFIEKLSTQDFPLGFGLGGGGGCGGGGGTRPPPREKKK